MNDQDQRVRDYYQNLSMPQDRIDTLLDIAADTADTIDQHATESHIGQVADKPLWRRFKLPRFTWLVGAQVGTAAALILMMSLWMHNSGSESERTLRTVQEVAMNHTTRLEPEYRGESLAMLDNSMQQLPFALVLPKSIDDSYELIGSRYCSLGGELAAHVRMKNGESGKPISLFVTTNSAQLLEIPAQQTKLDGVDVKLWREGGLFFALAKRS